jgi:chemotaxis protein CheD
MAAPGLTGFERKLVIGLAEFAVSTSPDVILSTYSLGSCLGVALYDPLRRVGGMAHVMLPNSVISPDKAAARPGMFIDTALPALWRAAANCGADPSRLLVYVAGGAQIMDDAGFFSIGKRNYEALAAFLRQQGLRPQAEAVGGMVNRTMYLHIATGAVWLKVSGQPQEVPLCNR